LYLFIGVLKNIIKSIFFTVRGKNRLDPKCSGKLCNKTSISIRKNSFFSNSKLPLQTLVLISYDWFRNVGVKEVAHEYNITKKSVIDWFRFIRDVCIEKLILLNLGAKIGGPNLVFEVD
jgi:hypothetical protein